MIKIEINRIFLINQRFPGRPGCLGGIDKLKDVERIRQTKTENTILRPSTSTSNYNPTLIGNDFDLSLLDSSDSSDDEITERYFISRKKEKP